MKTLIAYATKHGTTEKCALMLTGKLKGTVETCNLMKNAAPNPAEYDRIIIGGSIYAGRIQKEVTEFCSRNLEELKNKELGLFICCMFIDKGEEQLNNSFPRELLDIASVKESFGGEMRYSSMSFLEKSLTRMVLKSAAKTDKNLVGINVKEDFSLLSIENIDKFSARFNNA